MIKRFIEKLRTLRLYFVRRSDIMIKDEELSEFIVKIQHKVPRRGSIIVKHKDKYYRIRELG